MRLDTQHEPADGAEDDSGSPHDPVDGNPAAADHGPAGTHPARAAGKPGPGTQGRRRATARRRRGGRRPQPTAETDDAADPERELVIDETGNNELDFDRLEALNRDWEDHFNEGHRPSRNGIDEEGDKKHDAMQNMPSRPQSLQDYLNDQLAFLDITPETAEAAPLPDHATSTRTAT